MSIENSVISDLFCGQLLNRAKCMKCFEEMVSFEPFLTLSLTFKRGKKWSYSLQEMLEDYFEQDISSIDENQQQDCEQEHCYSRGSVFWKLPEILVFHFKRFTDDGNAGYKKIDYELSYPVDELDLADFVKESGKKIVRRN